MRTIEFDLSQTPSLSMEKAGGIVKGKEKTEK
jgi:hypothetical protein